jgi:hypothetical protein
MSTSKLGALDKTMRASLVGDEPCVAGVYARIPLAMRDALHVEAQRRGVGLNTLCMLAFDAILKGDAKRT